MSAEEIGIYFTIAAALVAGAWAVYRHFSAKETDEGATQQVTDGDRNIQVERTGGDVTIHAGPDVDVAAIVDKLAESARREGALSMQLENASEREEALRDQVRQLTDAVQALSDERNKADAPAGIDEALALLAKGETDAAEAVFQEVKQRRKAEGEESRKETAAAARHIGALAFLHDTDKALSAYREAVELDPENSDGWNQLGHLLDRIGDLEGAEGAYGHVLSLGNQTDDKELIAVATGNLGVVYRTRGDLDRAEEMHMKSLALDEALGRKEGMASHYGNLGLVYQTRGDLDRAEEMHKKSLAIEKELGRMEGIASGGRASGNR